ncbi:hypothetical protein ACFQ14_14285 [Pseudahrensia aquimaris]|uniref:Uncharacterized protein n=1 Tax=Pseudahrensia aquimaris TaxID=744461 RepID=A0ABW3FHI3_9HYPH
MTDHQTTSTDTPDGPCIWMSSVQTSSTHQKSWLTTDLPDERTSILTQHLSKLLQRSERSEPVDIEEYPSEFYEPRSQEPYQYPNTLHLFKAGPLFVSPESASVIRDFDIAPGFLKPVTLYKSDKTTIFSEGFCILYIGVKKNAFLPELSEGARDVWKGELWATTPNPSLQVTRFSEAALSGADIWRDERILSKFFISDRLYRALESQGLAKDWDLTRCPVVLS